MADITTPVPLLTKAQVRRWDQQMKQRYGLPANARDITLIQDKVQDGAITLLLSRIRWTLGGKNHEKELEPTVLRTI